MSVIYVLHFDLQNRQAHLIVAPGQRELVEVPSELRQQMADNLRSVADDLERLG